MHNITAEWPHILVEIKRNIYFKTQGRLPYSPELLRFALMQRYTSSQAYTMLVEEFPLPSLSLLKKLALGGIDPVKALHGILVFMIVGLQKSIPYVIKANPES